MKNEIRLALLCMAAVSVPALAQSSSPQCESTNYIQSRNVYSIVNPAAGALNQQCFLTLAGGNYEIELTGGGGGGGGALFNSGGGGAGAVPVKTTRYLEPGTYRLTIGRGGEAGDSNSRNSDAGRGGDGNPTSLSNAHTNETVAGYTGAEFWAGAPRTSPLSGFIGNSSSGAGGSGAGGQAIGGQSDGGSGGQKDKEGHVVMSAQDGGMLKVAGYNAPGGKAGSDAGGGGGGAGYGKGADGVDGGGLSSTPGGRGGDGFIALRALDPIAQAPAPAAVTPAYVAPAAAPAPAMRPSKKDRN